MSSRNSCNISISSDSKEGSDETPLFKRKNPSIWRKLQGYFTIPPEDLVTRLFFSMVPPFLGTKFQQVHVDLVGPLINVFMLTCVLYYGYIESGKELQAGVISPLACLVLYIVVMPVIIYLLAKVGRSRLEFLEAVSLFGYSLFGHVLTLLITFLFYSESSMVVFFCSLVIFGGLGTGRLVLILLSSIPLPAAQLIVCSVVGVANLLFLIFVHFVYMHKTFVYGTRTGESD